MPVQTLLDRLRAQGEHETYPLATPEDLDRTDRSLGVALPPSYRSFASTFSNGAYLFMLQEVSAAGAGNAQIGAIQDVSPHVFPPDEDAVVTSSDGKVPRTSLVPFSLDGNCNCWCFLTSLSAPGGEYPVAYCDTEQHRLVARLAGFEEWLTVLITEQNEVIRALDGGRWENELGLG